MTTEPLAALCCQVIEEDGNTDEIQASNRLLVVETKEQGALITNNSLGHLDEYQSEESEQLKLDADKPSEPNKLKDIFCDIRSSERNNNNNNNNNCKETTSIDSRSILINKERLKKFWESRMEMEFKSRQRQKEQQELNSSDSKNHTNNKNRKFAGSAGAKLADENNNRNVEEQLDDEQQQQVVNLSDEEWRSLSPDFVAPSSDHQTKQQTIAAAASKQKLSDGGQEKVPKQPIVIISNNLRDYKSQRHSSSSTEQQPMSIDPTLCHPQSLSSSTSGSSSSSSSSSNGNRLLREPCILEDATAESADVIGRSICPNEEQTINEEFSSTSSSSFGPMSISHVSLAQVNENQKPGDDEEEQEQEVEDEEPNDSTLSGSVLTVITQAEQQQQQQPNEELDNGDNNCDNGDEEETGSNIGVAFESLHFDNEIKSSKQEKVDEHLLLLGGSEVSPPPAAKIIIGGGTKLCDQQPQSRFSAKEEVKSVCNLITAAISDASRQVENFLHQGTYTKTSEHDDDERVIRSGQEDKTRDDVERATFVEASPLVSGDEAGAELELPGSEQDIPRAAATDLSSIFEANVRREIQRFEKHSSSQADTMRSFNSSSSSSSSNQQLLQTGNNNNNNKAGCGLTEWRIAEEIRLFNEREMELKRRLVANNNGAVKRTGTTAAEDCGESQVVRFGKTLRIPKSAAVLPLQTSNGARCSNGNGQQQQQHSGESIDQPTRVAGIKLSSSFVPANATQQQQQPSISMHKFIASGGKRFVLTSPIQQQQHQHQHQLSKSMSSLSMGSSISAVVAADRQHQKPADYKAVDSLRCKETPNVEPGMARKVIESFSRLRGCQEKQKQQPANEPRLSSLSSMAQVHFGGHSNRAPSVKSQQATTTTTTATILPSSTSSTSCSAEWKIQEELREMRAREAELRNQQMQRQQQQQQQLRMQQQQQQQAGSCSGDRQQQLSNSPAGGGPSQVLERESSSKNIDEPVRHISTSSLAEAAAATTTTTKQRPTTKTVASVSFSLSSESLYPIKQAIDSFRRLNNSPQVGSSKLTPQSSSSSSSQINGTIQKQRINGNDDDDNRVNVDDENYDSKVGGQRRKIALIERWECKNNVC